MRAASLTDEGRGLLKQARLTEELQPPGFEALTGFAPTTPRRAAKRAKPTTKTDGKAERRHELTEARETVRRLKAEERELASAARAAARDADRAEAGAAKLRQEADTAQAAAKEAGERVSQAEAELEQLR
jgi:methyl-accepting chemotaxis protein